MEKLRIQSDLSELNVYRKPATPDANHDVVDLNQAAHILESDEKRIYDLPDEVFWTKITEFESLKEIDQEIIDKIISEFQRTAKNHPGEGANVYSELLQTVFSLAAEEPGKLKKLFKENGDKISSLRFYLTTNFERLFDHYHSEENNPALQTEELQNLFREAIRKAVPPHVIQSSFYPNRLSRQPLQKTALSEKELQELFVYCVKNEEPSAEDYNFTYNFSDIIQRHEISESLKPEVVKTATIGYLKLALPILLLFGGIMYYEKAGFEPFVIIEALLAIALYLTYLMKFTEDHHLLKKIRKSKSKPLSSEKLELLAGLIQKRNSINRFKTSHSFNQKELIDSAIRLLLTGELKTADLLVDGQIDFSKVLDRIKPDLSYPENLRRRVKVETHEIIDAEFEDEEIEEDIPFKRVLKTSSKTGF